MSNPKLDNIQSVEEKRILLARLLEKKAQASKLAYPLSYNQQGMWFLYKFHPYSPAYNVAFTVRIRSTVDGPSLRRALQKLVDRHPALRTIITEQQGELVQQIYGYREVHFEEIDASNWNEEQLYEQVVTTYQRPFDLENGPLFRAHLFTGSTTNHVLLLAAHHIIMDGWSVWVLLDELRHFYTAEKTGGSVSMPSLKRQYADYVQWQRDLLAGPEGKRSWNYWQQQLGGRLPVLNLPTDHPRPIIQTYNGASHSFELDAQLIQRIKSLGQAENATLYTMLLTAFQVLLYRYSHQEDILVGSPVTDRSHAEFAGVIGDFVNMVVLRADLTGDPSFRMLLHRSRNTILNMFDHQSCPFSLLVEKLGRQRDLSRSPIFQVAFDLQRLQQAGELAELLMPGIKETSISFGDLKLEAYQISQQEGQFDVTLQLLETKGSVIGVFKYNTDLFKASTIAQMAENYQTLLQVIIANPDCLISELPLLTGQERKQLLIDSKQTQREYLQAQDGWGDDKKSKGNRTVMGTAEFFSYLQSLDVKLWAEGDRLHINAPKDVLTQELKTELSRRKAEILAFLQASQTHMPPDVSLSIQPCPRNEALPLSFPQQRLWFLDQFEPGNVAYNIPMAIRLKGMLNVPALEQSLNEIVKRHEALRTTFALVNDQPAQRINPYIPFTLPLVNLEEVPETERVAEGRRLIQTEAQRPFDLTHGPLFRFSLLALAEAEHVLLINMHHIVSDGWSIAVLVQELQALYGAFRAGQPSPLPDLPIQYADFAYWQRQWLQGHTLADHLAYCKQQLGGSLPVLELPTDHPRPAVQTYKGAVKTFVLPQPLLEALKSLGKEEGCTLFMVILTTFKTLLYRYTGQTDMIIGTPVANRNRVEQEKLIGFFVNNLVLRTDLSNNPTFRELLGRVRGVALEAYAHQDLPFEVLVETLHPERDASRSPLFQTMYIHQSAFPKELRLPGLHIEPMGDQGGTAKFDLTLSTWEQPANTGPYPDAGLGVSFEYNTDLFEAETIARMMGHFQILLEAVTANPNCPISNLPLLTQLEQQQMLLDWNQTQADYPQTQSLQHLFEAQVEQTPEAVAIVFEDSSLTYQELNRRANQLAHYLQTLGVGPDVLVGIYMERSLEMMVALWGVLKAGGAYVPLDPMFPPDRLDYMLTDSQAKVLLTQKRLLSNAPEYQGPVVCIDEDWPTIAHESLDNVKSGVAPNDLAYVIYTSGSTGRPKGVQIERRALLNFLLSMRQKPGLSAQDVLLAVTTLSFDIAGLELLLPLLVGARLVIVSSAVAVDGIQLLKRITNSGATVLQATPATWRLLLAAGWSKDQPLKVICGGEAMPRELADQLLERSDSVWNIYGPTETTIWSTVHRVKPGTGPVSIGRPIANTQVYILDAQLQPVPIGVTGEFYIGGDGLARGYLHRPELTAEKFIPNPFNSEPGQRLYRTGDLARYWPDGNIDFLGRIDHQVKIRGFRIELGEIEMVLSQHPAIRQAVVVVREDVPGDKRLVAYLIATDTPPPSASDLRSSLKDRLPDYMIPALFVFLDSYPLTPNGKINRRALPTPDGLRPDLEATYVAPQTEVERKIASIWQEALRLEKVGINDNFFELGGHSLLVIQIHSKLHQIFEKELSIADMFRYPTIASLANYLSRESNGPLVLQKIEDRARRQKHLRQARRRVQ